MKTEFLSAEEACACAARLSAVESVAAYGNHEASKAFAKLAEKGFMCDFLEAGSQSEAVSKALGSGLCGKRPFVCLAECTKEFSEVSSMRLPMVAAGSSAFSLRDSGWIIFLPESNQEIADSVMLSYCVSEDSKVLLPSIINVGFSMREPVVLPTDQLAKKIMPKLRSRIDMKKPAELAPADDKAQKQRAMKNAIEVISKIGAKWAEKTRHSFGLVEKYFLDDAEYALVVAGYHSPTAKAAVNKLREQGEKVGLLRLKVLRPLPVREIADALQNVKKAAVIDNNISPGSSGILYSEVRQCYNAFASNFIALNYMGEEDFTEAFSRLKKSEKEERVWI